VATKINPADGTQNITEYKKTKNPNNYSQLKHKQSSSFKASYQLFLLLMTQPAITAGAKAI